MNGKFLSLLAPLAYLGLRYSPNTQYQGYADDFSPAIPAERFLAPPDLPPDHPSLQGNSKMSSRYTSVSYPSFTRNRLSKGFKKYYKARTYMKRRRFSNYKWAKPAMRPELKTLDYDVTGGNFSSGQNASALVFFLNSPQVGAAFYNRLGNKVMWDSLHIKGFIAPLGVKTVIAQDFCKFAIIFDRNANGALPSAADIFLNYKNDGSTITTPQGGINPNNMDRFKVICVEDILTQPFVSDANGAITTGGGGSQGFGTILGNAGNYKIDRYIKLRGLISHYKASANPSAIGDVASGSFLGLLMTDNTANPASFLQFIGTMRFRFHDIGYGI